MLINSLTQFTSEVEKYSPSYSNDLLEIVQSLREFHAPLAGRSVLVTGASGFLGKWLVDSFLALGMNVFAVTRDQKKAANALPYWKNCDRLKWIVNDLNSGVPVAAEPVDFVIHGAVDPHLPPAVALAGAQKLMKLEAKQFLFLSSGAAGNSTPYGQAKEMIEKEGHSISARSGVPFKILRGFAFLGPHQDLGSHYAAAQFFNSVMGGRAISLQGDGSPIRSYLYPVDFVRAVVLVLLKGATREVYEVGSTEAVTIFDLAGRINAFRKGPAPAISIQKRDAVSLSQSNSYLPDLARIEALGFRQQISLNEALERTAQFYSEVYPNSFIRA